MPSFVLSNVRLRDAWALVALSLLPAVLLAVLGFRALVNEEAAVRREAAIAVEAAATRLPQTMAQEIDDAARNLASAKLAGDDASIAQALPRPPFSEPFVLDASGTLRFPSPAIAADPEKHTPERCDEERRALFDPARKEAARAFLLDACEDARGESGRYVWPVLALDPLRDLPRVERWTRAHLIKLTSTERAAFRVDAEHAGAPSLVAILDAAPPRAEALVTALAEPAIRHALRERGGTFPLAGDIILGRARRLDDGRVVGFAAHPTTIAAWLETAGGKDVRFRLATPHELARPLGQANALATLTPSILAIAAPRDPKALEARATRSRRVLAATAAAGALLAAAAAIAFLQRLSAERRSSALRVDFVSAVSHELRTPLASIRMLAELLEENRVEENEREEVHGALAREARRMSDHVERLLGFGRLAAGRVVAKRSTERLDELVARAIDDFESATSLTVARHLAPVEADVDAAQIRLAVDNLLANARKYAPEGTPYEVTVGDDGVFALISVRDRGPGVSAPDRERIFMPFERGDDRLSRATEGSGIGLSLVAHVARAHDGDVRVESRPSNEGALFTIRIRKRSR